MPLSSRSLKYIVIFLTILTITASFIQFKYLPKLGLSDFYLHSINYAIFSFFLYLYFRSVINQKKAALYSYILTFMLLLVLSTIVEFLQESVPGRGFEITDIYTNFIGIWLGSLGAVIIYKFFK